MSKFTNISQLLSWNSHKGCPKADKGPVVMSWCPFDPGKAATSGHLASSFILGMMLLLALSCLISGAASSNTNDVQAVSAGSHLPGTVNISCTFASNTLARGFLAVIIPTQQVLSPVLFSVALRDDSSSEADVLVGGLAADTYNAVIFDIEQNGIPRIPDTLAAGTENVTVSHGPQFGTVLNTSSTATPPNESSVDMCLNVEHGVYTVAVFERQSDGVISNSSAYVSPITVTVTPQETGTPTPPLVATLPSEGNTLVIIIVMVLFAVATIAVVLGLMFMVFKRKKGRLFKVKLSEEVVRYETSPEVVGPLIIETPVEHYARLDICQTPVHIPIDRELKSVQYSVVDVKSLQPRATTESGHTTRSSPSEQRRSLSLDNLFTELHSVKSEWQKLGEALGLDEDRLDEIFTNNKSEEECLRVMLAVWFQKSWKPTWRVVANALVAIGENQLAERLYLMCVPLETTPSEPHSKTLPLESLQETQDDNKGSSS